MMEIRTALKCFNQRKCRFLTPCFYVCKRPVSISVKRGFYARKIPAVYTIVVVMSAQCQINQPPGLHHGFVNPRSDPLLYSKALGL